MNYKNNIQESIACRFETTVIIPLREKRQRIMDFKVLNARNQI